MQSFKTLESWPVDNVSASVISDGAVHFYGDVDRVFELMSVTKLLATYGFLVAIEEGVFELDSPMGPEGSTVRHLLSHASGVAFDKPVAEKGVGERRIYSSAGMDILADAVAAEAEMPFAEYLREAVFEPLGMENSELWGSAGHEARSTVADLTKFSQELTAPTLISPETLAEAFQVQFPELIGTVPGYGMQKPCPWGLGFEIKGQKSPHWTGDLMPENTAGHFGQSGTFFWTVPGSGQVGVVLTDRNFGPWAKPLWTAFNDEVWAELNS
ncbi:beta-lactamase class C [Corynebacterium glutamicum]|uniref:serine hydrolase domain-containing protein n=1 Tax=Corynebacterium glutamicum TaxID=1718 RepID=UPI00097EC2D7|nr:serine hydrolase domain-containing protein [Corynebacterium glutamicum]SJM45838.1 beta-lactamase class C [Corynebacterium glutamicum]